MLGYCQIDRRGPKNLCTVYSRVRLRLSSTQYLFSTLIFSQEFDNLFTNLVSICCRKSFSSPIEFGETWFDIQSVSLSQLQLKNSFRNISNFSELITVRKGTIADFEIKFLFHENRGETPFGAGYRYFLSFSQKLL